MMAAGILVFFTLVLSLKLDPASSQTTCNDFGFYCVSDTSFQQCIDNGPPVGPVNVCGAGTFCSMDCPLQCQENVPCTTTTTVLPTTTTTVLTTTTTTELPTTTTTVLPTTTTTELPTTTTVLPTTTTELPTTTTTVLTTTTTTELPTTTTTELPTTTTTTELPTTTTTTTELPTTTTTVLPPTTTTTELPTTTTTELPTTTTVLPTTTTVLTTTTTTELPTTTEAPFVCTASGRFADPTNCTNYYMCSPMSNGSFYQYLYPCPGGSVFNPATSKCTIDTTGTICPSSSSTTSTSSPATPSSSTTSTELPTTTEAPFVCTVSGRFADPTNCTNYYMCSPMTNGSFYQYLYPCPGGSVFNPATSKCTIDTTGTICPSSSSTSSTPSSTSSTSTTSTTASTPLSSPPSSSPTTSTSTSTSTSTTTTTTTTTVPPDFECTAPGRFADPLDCTKYYMCSSDGKGGFYKYLYTCPTGSAFNPATGKCSATAVCPLKLPLNNSASYNNKNNKSNNNVKKLSFNDVE